jgi:hypothetical protein
MSKELFANFADKVAFAYLAALRPGQGRDMALIEAVSEDAKESKRLGRLVGRLAAVFEPASVAPRSEQPARRSAAQVATQRPAAAVNQPIDAARAVLICEQVRQANTDALWSGVVARLNSKGSPSPVAEATPEQASIDAMWAAAHAKHNGLVISVRSAG